MDTIYFTDDNTEGYTPEQLRAANDEINRRIDEADMRETIENDHYGANSWLGHEKTQVLLWVEHGWTPAQ